MAPVLPSERAIYYTMFQHYLPRVYLQGFTDPNTPPGQEPFVWVFDVRDRSVKRRSPRNIGGENDYYETVGMTGGPGAGIEARLSKVESRVKSELDRLMAQGANALGFDDRLMWFVATLSLRTPWGRRATEQYFNKHSLKGGAMGELTDAERWAASVEYLAGWALEYFRRMEWLLIGPQSEERYFITSDRPVVMTSGNMDGSVMDVLRLTEKSSTVTVPLTSRLALIGSYSRAEFLTHGVTVDWFNERVLGHAERFLYSSGEAAARAKPEAIDPRPI